ncbi:hypothetical protein JCM11251_000416 [Rhodosporidiobolus azoricus]
MPSTASSSRRAAIEPLREVSEVLAKTVVTRLTVNVRDPVTHSSNSGPIGKVYARLSTSSSSTTSGTLASTYSSYISFASLGVRSPEDEKHESQEKRAVDDAATESAYIGSARPTLSRTHSFDSYATSSSASTVATSVFSAFSSSKLGRTLRSFASFFGAESEQKASPHTLAASESATAILDSSRQEAIPTPTSPSSPQVNLNSATASSPRASFILDDYTSTDLLHVIWGEIHPWQIVPTTSSIGDEET